MANKYANLVGTDKIKDSFGQITTGFDGVDADITAHLADRVTDADGVHGLKVESGTWTPVLKGDTTAGSPTYTVRSGSYYKIGSLVYITARVTISSKGGMVGAVSIGGLPFVPGSVGTQSIAKAEMANLTYPAAAKEIYIYVSGNNLTFAYNTSGGSPSTIKDTDISNTFEARLSGTYQA